jgi:hypothetical protein
LTTSATTKKWNAGVWRPRNAAGWISLAASPGFAMMAWIVATGAPRVAVCAADPAMPIHGMAWMYLLMSFFHVSHWLKLISNGPDGSTLN